MMFFESHDTFLPDKSTNGRSETNEVALRGKNGLIVDAFMSLVDFGHDRSEKVAV